MMDIYDIETDSFSQPAEGEVPNRLLSICLRLYYWCNLRCVYCLSDSSPTRSNKVSGNVKYVVKAISERGALRIIWSGGEPLLYKELSRLLFISHSKGNVNVVSTNGTITPVQEDLQHIDWIQISCPSTNLEIYEKMRRSKDLHLVLKNAENLVRMKARVALFLPLSVWNISTACQTIKDWISIGARKIVISRILPLGRALHWGVNCPSDQTIIELKQEIEKLHNAKDISVIWPAIKKRYAQENGYIVIDSNGELISPTTTPTANLLSDSTHFWETIQNFYKSHWILFRESGH